MAEVQAAMVLRGNGSTYVLGEFGVETRALNALWANGIRTMDELVLLVGKYRGMPKKTRLSFHKFLGVRNLGPVTGQRVLDGFDAWRAAQGEGCCRWCV